MTRLEKKYLRTSIRDCCTKSLRLCPRVTVSTLFTTKRADTSVSIIPNNNLYTKMRSKRKRRNSRLSGLCITSVGARLSHSSPVVAQYRWLMLLFKNTDFAVSSYIVIDDRITCAPRIQLTEIGGSVPYDLPSAKHDPPNPLVRKSIYLIGNNHLPLLSASATFTNRDVSVHYYMWFKKLDPCYIFK